MSAEFDQLQWGPDNQNTFWDGQIINKKTPVQQFESMKQG